MRIFILSTIYLLSFMPALGLAEKQLAIDLDLPNIQADPYFRPYVAIWLEDTNRQPIETIALWYQINTENVEEPDGKKWLKDLRQWWRKLGRNGEKKIDAVTGATRKPGSYKVVSDLTDLADGFYLLNFEAAREEGSRTYKRIKIELPIIKKYVIEADIELGEINIKAKLD